MPRLPQRVADALDTGDMPTACTPAERATWGLLQTVQCRV